MPNYDVNITSWRKKAHYLNAMLITVYSVIILLSSIQQASYHTSDAIPISFYVASNLVIPSAFY